MANKKSIFPPMGRLDRTFSRSPGQRVKKEEEDQYYEKLIKENRERLVKQARQHLIDTMVYGISTTQTKLKEEDTTMELTIQDSKIIYDSGDRRYDLSEMTESHIMNVLGKFEVQRTVFARMAIYAENNNNSKRFKLYTKKVKKIDKKISIFMEELVRREKAEKAMKKLKDSIS